MRILQAAYAWIMREKEVQYNKMIEGVVSVQRQSDGRSWVCSHEDRSCFCWGHIPLLFFSGISKSCKSITFSKALEKPLLDHKHTFFYCPLLQASYCNHPSRVEGKCSWTEILTSFPCPAEDEAVCSLNSHCNAELGGRAPKDKRAQVWLACVGIWGLVSILGEVFEIWGH